MVRDMDSAYANKNALLTRPLDSAIANALRQGQVLLGQMLSVRSISW